MEKKVPERKVSLQDGDIIYVYDKRINRCIKPDCEGTVKYGLVLRVSVNEEETCNCFECNKCHMKYTPYPNYVRLTKTDMLNIYNQAEVTARDEKRAEDARKQALREKRKNAPAKSFDKTFDKSFSKKKDRPYEKKYERKYEKDGQKKYGNVVITRGSYSNSYANSTYSNSEGKRFSKPYDKNRSSSYKTRTNNYNNGYNKSYNKDHQE